MTNLSNRTILITGGAGFIGSALAAELNRRGYSNILICDVLGQSEKWRNLLALRFADYVEAAELHRRLEACPDAFGPIGTIFHLGACSSTTETDASFLIRNNFEYTKFLAHFALSRGSRFVYASSAATYGAEADDVPETAPLFSLRPLNMYGYSKHLFDLYAESAGILPHITGLKYFNIYGPNEHHKGNMRSMVHKTFHQIRENGRVKLFKSHRPEYRDGEQLRDFLYVKDAVDATIFLAEHTDGGGLYNIGSGEPRTWLDLVNAVFDALGREPQIDFIEMPEEMRPRYQYMTKANIGKLRAAGFETAFYTLEAAITDYIQSYLLPGSYLGDECAADALACAATR